MKKKKTLKRFVLRMERDIQTDTTDYSKREGWGVFNIDRKTLPVTKWLYL